MAVVQYIVYRQYTTTSTWWYNVCNRVHCVWLHVSTVNGHHQANKELCFKVQKNIIQWDPISFTVEYKKKIKNT